ncbi:putative 12-oxophytodienoate reductase 11, partial [Tetrabaena socialis]
APRPRSAAPASPLIAPLKLGDAQLAHRIAVSPMTRLRMEPGTDLPRDLNGLYYEQRSSQGGLVITECFAISADSGGYVRAPTMSTDAQAAAWLPVVKRVHDAGGVFYAQLFHA